MHLRLGRALGASGVLGAASALARVLSAEETRVPFETSVRADAELGGDAQGSTEPPAPLNLPELAHEQLQLRFDVGGARVLPREGAHEALGSESARAIWASLQQVGAELPLEATRWYLGAAASLLEGMQREGPRALVFGNPEVWLRGTWSHRHGLSTGGSLGVVLPLPRSLAEGEVELLRAARTVRPWDSAYFDDLTLTLRPAMEFRYVEGRTVVQLRQGLDLAQPLQSSLGNEAVCGSAATKLCAVRGANARSGLFVGYRLYPRLGLGAELWQTYQLTTDMDDRSRSTLAWMPNLALRLGDLEPSIACILPIGRPLRGDADSYLALLLHLDWAPGVP